LKIYYQNLHLPFTLNSIKQQEKQNAFTNYRISQDISNKVTKLNTAMSRMMTLLPFVYRKFLPFGSPPRTMDTPLAVLGRVANVPSTVTITEHSLQI